MRNFVEYIGGPKDGEEAEWTLGQSLPQTITIAGTPADYHAKVMGQKEITIDDVPLLLQGRYVFQRLHWHPWYPETQLGDYEWQGWE